MINNMLFKIARVLIVLPPLVLAALVSSCAQDNAQANGGVSNGALPSAQNTQGQYTNPGRPETYSADERGYEKPWPFGDLANNPQQ
jgi:hypothetical protein